jgi:hypothetical protein
MKVPIEDLVGKGARCDRCGMPARVEVPRQLPTAVGAIARGPPGVGYFPASLPMGPAVVPRILHYILACPRCGCRSIPEHTPLEPVPDPEEVSP